MQILHGVWKSFKRFLNWVDEFFPSSMVGKTVLFEIANLSGWVTRGKGLGRTTIEIDATINIKSSAMNNASVRRCSVAFGQNGGGMVLRLCAVTEKVTAVWCGYVRGDGLNMQRVEGDEWLTAEGCESFCICASCGTFLFPHNSAASLCVRVEDGMMMMVEL